MANTSEHSFEVREEKFRGLGRLLFFFYKDNARCLKYSMRGSSGSIYNIIVYEAFRQAHEQAGD